MVTICVTIAVTVLPRHPIILFYWEMTYFLKKIKNIIFMTILVFTLCCTCAFAAVYSEDADNIYYIATEDLIPGSLMYAETIGESVILKTNDELDEDELDEDELDEELDELTEALSEKMERASMSIYELLAASDTIGEAKDALLSDCEELEDIEDQLNSLYELYEELEVESSVSAELCLTLCEQAEEAETTLSETYDEIVDMFDGWDVDDLSFSYEGVFQLTGYSACYECCGKYEWEDDYGVTASGATATEGITIAMDSDYAFGTVVYIVGVGVRVVQDRGGAISGNIIDVYCEDYNDAFSAEVNCDTTVYVLGTIEDYS